MRKNNEKKKRILSYISAYVDQNGFSPSVRELCSMSGYKSTATVHRYIKQLESEGLISHQTAKSRTIVIEKGGQTVE